MNSNQNHQVISSFDLEPNPFEQSFASSKKNNSNVNTKNMNTNKVITSNHDTSSGCSEKYSFTHSTHVPNVNINKKSTLGQSPSILTPGESRILPPLLLSPQILQGHTGSNNITGMIDYTNTQVLQDNNSSVASLVNNTSGITTPNFFLNMVKPGFSSNESNLRTGLTSSILTSGDDDNMTIGVELPKNSSQTVSSVSTIPLKDNFMSSMLSVISLPESLDPVNSNIHKNTGVDNHSNSISTSVISLDIRPDTGKNKNNKINSPNQSTKKRKNVSTTKKLEIHNGDSNNNNNNNEVDNIHLEGERERKRKREEFLERNRVAASKFRRRKKEYIQKIENDLKFYKFEYDELTSIINTLIGLKNIERNNKFSGPPLIRLLRQCLLKQDLYGATNVLGHIENLILNTHYVRKNGNNSINEETLSHSDDQPDIEEHLIDENTNFMSRNVSSINQPIHLNDNLNSLSTESIDQLPMLINESTILPLNKIRQ